MKIITLSKIGYNAPKQANWSWGIWKLDLIDTMNAYSMSHTMKENFGGDSRFRKAVKEELGYDVLETKGTYTGTGTPEIKGVTKLIDLESKKALEIVKEFLGQNNTDETGNRTTFGLLNSYCNKNGIERTRQVVFGGRENDEIVAMTSWIDSRQARLEIRKKLD